MTSPRTGQGPAYQRLAAELRDRIARGVYPPGGRLPSEAHLVQECGLGRTTVRRAIAVLRAEGVVIVEHGWGMRVAPPRELEELSPPRGSRVETRPPTPEERETLVIPEGVSVFVVEDPDGWIDVYPGHQYALRLP